MAKSDGVCVSCDIMGIGWDQPTEDGCCFQCGKPLWLKYLWDRETRFLAQHKMLRDIFQGRKPDEK